MSATEFAVGMQFCERNRRFCVVKEEGVRKRIVRDETSGALETRDVSALRQAFRRGTLEHFDLFSDRSPTVNFRAVNQALSDYSEKQREEVAVKVYYLQEICPGGVIQVRRDQLKKALFQLHKELPFKLKGVALPKSPPGASTFYEWLRCWRHPNFLMSRLVNRYDLRGGRSPKALPATLKPIMERVIDEFHAKATRPTVSATLESIEAQVNEANKYKRPNELIPKPTRRLLQRFLDGMDREELLNRRYGPAVARRRTRIFGKAAEVTRLLERVEMDHTPLDLLCIAEDGGMLLGRPYLTVLIDKASRMILGVWISFRPPNASTVLRC
ncbi:hypothetical protein [Rhizobacter fulvus]